MCIAVYLYSISSIELITTETIVLKSDRKASDVNLENAKYSYF